MASNANKVTQQKLHELTDLKHFFEKAKQEIRKEFGTNKVAVEQALQKLKMAEPVITKLLPFEEIKSLHIANTAKIELAKGCAAAMEKSGNTIDLLNVYAEIKRHKGVIPAEKIGALETWLGAHLVGTVPEGTPLTEHLQHEISRIGGALNDVGIKPKSLKKLVLEPTHLATQFQHHFPSLMPVVEKLLESESVQAAREITPISGKTVVSETVAPPETPAPKEAPVITETPAPKETPHGSSSGHSPSSYTAAEEAVEGKGRKWFEFLTHNAEGKFSGERAIVSAAAVAAVGLGVAAYNRRQREQTPEPEVAR